MSRRIKAIVIAVGLIIILAIAIVVINLIQKYTPSKERADLTQYYGLEQAQEEELAVIVDNKVAEDKSIIYDNNVYINLKTVKESINDKFYWDYNENVLIFTTPTDVIKADIGSKDYYVNKDKSSMNYVIVKSDGSNVYIAADFIKAYTGIEYKLYEDPNRVCITNTWGEFTVFDVKSSDTIRVRAGVKSPIIADVKKGDIVTFIEKEGNWTKVNFEGGYIGYIKTKYLTDKRKETRTTDFQQPVYTNISKAEKINLTWHQTTNSTANNSLVNLTSDTKGINVISPTWFTLADDQGNIKSLADSSYVNTAHQMGYEVWALIADFADSDTDGTLAASVLPYTSKRENLINKLISTAIEYNLDGLNIDFEKVKEAYSEDYLQFLRELSIKCRKNNLVLSVDNYVPSDWSYYYDLEEQGEIVDYVVIMAYDEYNSTTGEAGPVASIGFVDQAIKDIAEDVNSSKVIIGIPFYTRVWQEDGNNALSSKTYGMSSINDIISNKGLTKNWLSDLGVNYCEYEDNGSTYKMWIEDAQSIEEKMKLINKSNAAGVASWKLGLEDPSIWNIIVKYVN